MKIEGHLLIASLFIASAYGDVFDDLKGKGYKKLVELVEEVKLKDAFLGYQPFTLFAPKDAALSSLDSKTAEEKKEILMYHVIDKTIYPSEMLLQGTNKLETASNSQLNVDKFKNNIITANGIKVTKPDIEDVGKYNIVHEVEDVIPVLHPAQSILSVLTSNGKFKKLLDAVAKAGLVNDLNHDEDQSITVFAPTDEAFNNQTDLDDFLNSGNKEKLVALIKAHVLPKALYSVGMENDQEYQTLNDEDTMKIEKTQGNKVTVYKTSAPDIKANVIKEKFDVPATNGVIHSIDKVLYKKE